MLVSLALMLFGVLLLLSNLNIALGMTFKQICSIALIVLGVIGFIEKLICRKSFWARNYIMLITVGVIFFLYYNYSINFWKSWPILLVAIGFSGMVNKVMRKVSERISSKTYTSCD